MEWFAKKGAIKKKPHKLNLNDTKLLCLSGEFLFLYFQILLVLNYLLGLCFRWR